MLGKGSLQRRNFAVLLLGDQPALMVTTMEYNIKRSFLDFIQSWTFGCRVSFCMFAAEG